MSNFPDQIRNYIFDYVNQKCSIAYLKVDQEGLICELGGELEKYDLNLLEIGQKISDSLEYLSDFLPLTENPFILEELQIKSNLFVDIHFFSLDDTDWILWLDRTCSIHLKQRWQQKYNELNLLKKKYNKLYQKCF